MTPLVFMKPKWGRPGASSLSETLVSVCSGTLSRWSASVSRTGALYPVVDSAIESPRTSHTRFDAKEADRGFPPMLARSPVGPSQTRRNERLARVLRQKRAPDAVMVGVLCVALILGLALIVHENSAIPREAIDRAA